VVSTAPRQFSGISFFSLPALSFLILLPHFGSLVPNLGRFVPNLCGRVPIFCRDEVSFDENIGGRLTVSELSGA